MLAADAQISGQLKEGHRFKGNCFLNLWLNQLFSNLRICGISYLLMQIIRLSYLPADVSFVNKQQQYKPHNDPVNTPHLKAMLLYKTDKEFYC